MSRRFDRELFFELLEKDDREGKCAELAGVTPQHICRLKRIDPAFADEVERRLAKFRSTRRASTLKNQHRELSAHA